MTTQVFFYVKLPDITQNPNSYHGNATIPPRRTQRAIAAQSLHLHALSPPRRRRICHSQKLRRRNRRR